MSHKIKTLDLNGNETVYSADSYEKSNDKYLRGLLIIEKEISKEILRCELKSENAVTDKLEMDEPVPLKWQAEVDKLLDEVECEMKRMLVSRRRRGLSIDEKYQKEFTRQIMNQVELSFTKWERENLKSDELNAVQMNGNANGDSNIKSNGN